MKVTVDIHGMVSYRYKVPGGGSFHFRTLSEVGEPYQQQALSQLAAIGASRGLKFMRGLNMPFRPYVADFFCREGVPDTLMSAPYRNSLYFVDAVDGVWYVFGIPNGRQYRIGTVGSRQRNNFELACSKAEALLRSTSVYYSRQH